MCEYITRIDSVRSFIPEVQLPLQIKLICTGVMDFRSVGDCIIAFHGNNSNAAHAQTLVNSLVPRLLFVKQCQVVREEVVGIMPSRETKQFCLNANLQGALHQE